MEVSYEMNQTCKVCGEPAAGFHFGAFTCEGCKSFFGRSYNNINSINDCKNNNRCVINKKNRTSCKSCRLRKCLEVGMSKNGSRYGRRSNWFKIHCLLQEQQQKEMQEHPEDQTRDELMPTHATPPPLHQHQMGLRFLGVYPYAQPVLQFPRSSHPLHVNPEAASRHIMGDVDCLRESAKSRSLNESFRHSASPSVSSPESHNSDSSMEIPDPRRIPLIPGLLPPTFLPPPGLLFPPGYPPFYPGLLQPAPTVSHNGNVENVLKGNVPATEAQIKRSYLDAVLQLQRCSAPLQNINEDEDVEDKTPEPTPNLSPVQEFPIDLSMKATKSS